MYGVRTAKGNEGAGYLAHEADCAAAVDELGVGFVKSFGEGARGGHVDG